MNGVRGGFDRTLEVIEAKVIELFGLVAEDLPAGTQALLHGRGDMAAALADREQFVDALYRQVEVLAARTLLLQAPVASDLRFLLSVMRIAPELERSHDLVMQVASYADPFLRAWPEPARDARARRSAAKDPAEQGVSCQGGPRPSSGRWRRPTGRAACGTAPRRHRR